MSSLRFAFILLLTVVLDLSPLPPPHATWEIGEEFEEVARLRGSRRPVSLVRDATPRAVARDAQSAALQRPRRPLASTTRPQLFVVSIRKLPPSISDSPSAPDAH